MRKEMQDNKCKCGGYGSAVCVDCGAYLAGSEQTKRTVDLQVGDIASFGFGFKTVAEAPFKWHGKWFVRFEGQSCALQHHANMIWLVKAVN